MSGPNSVSEIFGYAKPVNENAKLPLVWNVSELFEGVCDVTPGLFNMIVSLFVAIVGLLNLIIDLENTLNAVNGLFNLIANRVNTLNDQQNEESANHKQSQKKFGRSSWRRTSGLEGRRMRGSSMRVWNVRRKLLAEDAAGSGMISLKDGIAW